MRIITVLGARPQFIKAAPVGRALAAAGVVESILHTGQHYDEAMSGVFFAELGIAEPRWNLACGGGTQGAMTGAMLAGVEQILLEEKPDAVMVYGDTNSTLAGALAAAKLHIPVVHVEAGLRSFNRRMPEEINRICTDHVADLLFCSSRTGADLLAAEGITAGVHITGDIMADVFFDALAKVRSGPSAHNGFATRAAMPEKFALMTLHRAENTDDPGRMASIMDGVSKSPLPVVFPVHPRTSKSIRSAGAALPANVRAIDPVGYFEMAALVDAAEFILTDSGGLQKEAYWAGRSCITMRDETEWTETLEAGWNVLTGASGELVAAAMANPPKGATRPALYGDGHAADRMTEIIISHRQ